MNRSVFRTYRLLVASILLTSYVCLAGSLVISSYLGPLSNHVVPETGHNDPTLDLHGWDELLPAFNKIREDDITNKIMTSEDPLVTHK